MASLALIQLNDLMRKSRSQFKLALRYCQQHSDMLWANAHANALTSKDYNGFWKSINQSNNDKSKKYTFTLDLCVGENEIANRWRKHFEQLYNSNADTSMKDDLYNLYNRIRVDCASNNGIRDDMAAVCKLKDGKATGPDGISSEAIKYACSRLSVHHVCCLIYS